MAERHAPIVDGEIRGPGLVGCSPRVYCAVEEGAGMLLEREPSNPIDRNAIILSLDDGTAVGYLARERAAIIAPWIDEGWIYTGRVIRAAREKYAGRGRMRVYYIRVRCTPIPPITAERQVKKSQTTPTRVGPETVE